MRSSRKRAFNARHPRARAAPSIVAQDDDCEAEAHSPCASRGRSVGLLAYSDSHSRWTMPSTDWEVFLLIRKRLASRTVCHSTLATPRSEAAYDGWSHPTCGYPQVFEYLQKSLPRAISAGSGHDRRRGAIPPSAACPRNIWFSTDFEFLLGL